MANIIAKISLDNVEDPTRNVVEIGDTAYALKNIPDFDLKEYGRLLRLTEFVGSTNMENMTAEVAEQLDKALDECLELLFYDKLPRELLDRLRDVQKMAILQAFTDASRGSSTPISSTTPSPRSRRSTASALSTG